MTTSAIIHWKDEQSAYQIVIVASGPTSAKIDERSWPLGGGNMKESTYSLNSVEVVGGVLHAKADAPMWQTADVEVDLVAPSSFHLTVSGLRFGLGNADVRGALAQADYAALQDLFKTAGWPTS